MSEINNYPIRIVGTPCNVPRRFFDTEDKFTETFTSAAHADHPSDPDTPEEALAGDHPTPSTTCIALLPMTPLELDEPLFRNDVLARASRVVDTHRLRVESLRITGGQTIKNLQDKALAENTDRKIGKGRIYDRYARKHYGKPYSELVDNLRVAAVKRFHDAFAELMYVPPMSSNWPPYQRDIVNQYEVAATPEVLEILVDLAGQGHAHSQYLAGLLICFSERGLTPRAAALLLEAHDNKHPQALDAIARYLLVAQDYAAALRCALVSLQGGYTHADDTIRLIEQALGHRIIETRQGVVPAFPVLVHSLEDQFASLARRHFPHWFPSAEDESAAMRRFLARHAGGADNV